MHNYEQTDELLHYGVKGMKWGVRRYQNADGTLTEEGEHRLSKYKKKEYSKINKDYAKTLAATQSDTMSKVKGRQSVIKNTLDPKHAKSDQAIASNVKFENTASSAYKSINKSIKDMTYNQMISEKRIANAVRIGGTAVASMLGFGIGAIITNEIAPALITAGISAVSGNVLSKNPAENIRYRRRSYNQIMENQSKEYLD